MRLKLVLFAGAREAAGVAEAQLDFEEAELDTAALLVKLEAAYPKLAELLPRCALACNGEYADGVQPLADGDEVKVASYNDPIEIIQVLMNVVTLALFLSFGAVAMKNIIDKARTVERAEIVAVASTPRRKISRWLSQESKSAEEPTDESDSPPGEGAVSSEKEAEESSVTGIPMTLYGTEFADVSLANDNVKIFTLKNGATNEVACGNITRVSATKLTCLYPDGGTAGCTGCI